MNRDDTFFLRFIAIVLVLNSHLDLYYPVAHLGTGGAIGNALFFMLSGFGLLLSENKRPQSITGYLTKRTLRIYPSVLMVLCLIYFPLRHSQYTFELTQVLVILGKCLYPPFWFVKAIVMYYAIGFFLIKRYSRQKIVIALAVTFIAYLYVYFNSLDLTYLSIERTYIKFIFYLMIFVFGIYLADKNEKISYAGPRDVVLFFVSVFILYGHKYLMVKGMFGYVQIIQQLILFVLVYSLFKISRSPFVLTGIMQHPVIGKVVRFVSGITLELYIVHESISPSVLRLNLSFPTNIIVFLIASFILAIMIKWLVGMVLIFTTPLQSRT